VALELVGVQDVNAQRCSLMLMISFSFAATESAV